MEGFEIQETPESDGDNTKETINTLDRLIKIQELLKKESALNELCR